MTTRTTHRIALAIALAVLAGCTTVPSVQAPPAPAERQSAVSKTIAVSPAQPAPATKALTGPTGTMAFRIAIPHGKRADRKLNYVSGATTWIRIVANGAEVVSEAVTQDMAPSASGAVVYTGDNAGADLYTITAKMPVGADYPVVVETYNATMASQVDAAHFLCTGTKTVTVTEQTANDLGTLTLNGIPAYVNITNDNFNLSAGTPGTGNLTCAALDAGGNPIVGDYAYPVILSESHDNLTLADPNITSDADTATVVYDGMDGGSLSGTMTDLEVTVNGTPLIFAGTPTIFWDTVVTSILIDAGVSDTAAYRSGSGGTLTFTAQIGTNDNPAPHSEDPMSALDDITWSLTGATDAASFDAATGILTFSGDATKYGLVTLSATNMTSGTSHSYPIPIWRVETDPPTHAANVANAAGTIHLPAGKTLVGIDESGVRPTGWSAPTANGAGAGNTDAPFTASWTTDGSAGTPALEFISSDGYRLVLNFPFNAQ